MARSRRGIASTSEFDSPRITIAACWTASRPSVRARRRDSRIKRRKTTPRIARFSAKPAACQPRTRRPASRDATVDDDARRPGRSTPRSGRPGRTTGPRSARAISSRPGVSSRSDYPSGSRRGRRWATGRCVPTQLKSSTRGMTTRRGERLGGRAIRTPRVGTARHRSCGPVTTWGGRAAPALARVRSPSVSPLPWERGRGEGRRIATTARGWTSFPAHPRGHDPHPGPLPKEEGGRRHQISRSHPSR